MATVENLQKRLKYMKQQQFAINLVGDWTYGNEYAELKYANQDFKAGLFEDDRRQVSKP